MTTTLLAVDDSKTMRRVLEITFAGEDYKVATAENADEALRKLQAERPQVALVDAGLEGTSGYDLCQRLKAAQPGLRVVILASRHQPYDRARGTQVGADDFAEKPFETQALIDKVSALVKAAGAPAPAPAPQQPDASARLRAQTLSYTAGAAPVGPAAAAGGAPAPAPRPPAPVMPAAAARPVAPIPRQQTMIGTPPPPEAAAAVRAPAAAPAAPAPAPSPVAPAVAALTSNGSELAQKLSGLGLTRDQADAVLALSREVVERVVWEVVPTLAEALIKEEIRRLTSD